tara:strand:+ start:139 stop:348 length:210 start_codon:yes stop_codon:yes gene_type:complete
MSDKQKKPTRTVTKYDAVRVVCGDCEFTYKTTNNESKKCIDCESRNIEITEKDLPITYEEEIPTEDLED